MTKVKQQLLDLMSILQERARLNPDGAAFQITIEQLSKCPDHDALLSKLEQEHEVIEVNQRPDERGLGDADHGMFEAEQPKNYGLYMSYFVTLKPTFTAFYKTEYTKHRSTIATLTDYNRELTISIMRAIDDEVSLTGNGKVSIDPVQSDELCRKGLDFLKKVEAIEAYNEVPDIQFDGDYERDMETGEVASFTVTVNLPVFDEALSELTTGINKEKDTGHRAASSSPDASIDYDDEHGKATYNGTTEKLFEANTMSGFLAYKVIRADGARLEAADIASDYEAKHPELDKDITTKTLTNAKDRINNRFAKAFGIEDVVCYERQQFWLNDKYCSPQSPYRDSTTKKTAAK